MLKGYIIIAFLIALVFPFNNKCDYICNADGCEMFKNILNNNISSIEYCRGEDVFTDVNFLIIEDNRKASDFPALIQIKLNPPKNVCKYELILLANESVDEKMCMKYNFSDPEEREVHSSSTICFISNDKQYKYKPGIRVPYIFTACYSIQFVFDKGIKMMKGNKFLETNYKRTEVVKPTFECRYNIESDSTSNKRLLLFGMHFAVSIIEGVKISLDTSENMNGEKVCFADQSSDIIWNFSVLDNYFEDKHHNNTAVLVNKKYKKDLTFQKELPEEKNYCAMISYDDIRCRECTLWKPLDHCYWHQTCHNITFSNHFGIQTNTNINAISYLPIIIITLTIFAIIVIMYIIYIVRICNVREKMFLINIFNGIFINTNKSKCEKSNICTSENIKIKMKSEVANIVNTDIILLYPKGPESFMALMSDFRGILSRVCQCDVYDWYDKMKWNDVAKIGAFDWFAEMLRKECRVIWIDTPATRLLITQRFKQNSEQYNFVKIGDFRDVVFPTIFNLSKCNIEQSTLHEPKHFIVRLKEFENFESDDDPFVDLSTHMRYFIPQDLKLLFTDLSVLESNINVPLITEEDFIKHHLCHVKSDFQK